MKTLSITKVLNKTQIDALNSTAITIVSAPGANKVFVVESIFISKTAGAAATAGTGDLQFVYTGDTGIIMSAFDVDAAAGVMGDAAMRFLKLYNTQTSATAGTQMPVFNNSVSVNKGIDVKASAAIVAAASTALQITVTGYVYNIQTV